MTDRTTGKFVASLWIIVIAIRYGRIEKIPHLH